ncbi:MAG: hypothetical protein DWH91_07725 [Planctomycetota bacterium]|nr:MAG: hypothetical protein DWH91_07725 [Planctomycetota bacterium]
MLRWLLVLLIGGWTLAYGPIAEAQSSRTRTPKLEIRVEPGPVPLYRTRNYAVMTDLPEDEARELLARLETMLVLISRYWGKPNSQSIDMYVVRDVKKWPEGILSPEGLDHIEAGGGVTLGQTQQNALTGQILASRAMVYAVADRGTPQHEAVHAYCMLNFGRTGPVWYSEGMAEMGQYWVDKDPAVHCHPEVVKYLKSETPKPLTEITELAQQTGDSWQNYAWRWALCHLLANNPNYAPRFHPLGMALLNGQRTSFEDVYGPMAREISFEYLQFLKNFDIGYRADLCGWDWKAKFSAVLTRPLTAKIKAAGGWQPARILVKSGETYQYSTQGEWALAKDGEKVTAAGTANGQGRLEAVIFHNYELSEVIELGTEGTLTAPIEGKLFLRCRDSWAELGDNSGEVTVKLTKPE